jgi:N-acetyl-gamma-glutamyl-phosphate reductase
MKPKIFIDGEVGTTGLQIRERLAKRGDVEVVSIDPARRKEAAARAEMINGVDMVILCLPDDGAREAVSLITSNTVKVIDASTAHRVADGWTYGFPELPGQREAIAKSRRVSNPGCWPTGAIALIRPLVDAGMLSPSYPITVSGVSGYSGGGKAMIAAFENPADPTYTKVPYRSYGLELKHKHVPELQMYSGLRQRPLFSPAVGRFAQGMIVEVPLHLGLLPGTPSLEDVHAALSRAYDGQKFVRVVALETSRSIKTLPPEGLNGTNCMELYVFGSGDQARLVALFDNLGKGASGAAVQNMNIMLGLPEAAGLE